ncbi:DUF6230 family protein [Knoellia sinensis]|uniref:DUF6230 family protein n=1 Tax=Knoellia sinensis TaxID=136100 RepID=UPI0012EC5F9C|nr:DUF6230 family protein [Knoellia sinensis]
MAPAVAGFAALGAMFTLVTQNALAVNFTSVDTAYKVYTNKISGTHGAGFIDEQQTKNNGKVAVSEMGFAEAKLAGLCAIAHQNLPTVGDVSFVLRAGETVDGTLEAGAEQVSATKLFFASPGLSGYGDEIASLNLGQSADSVTMNGDTFPAPMAGAPGAFGLQAKVLTISNLKSQAYGIDLQGSIKLPNLRIQIVPGKKDHADCATLANPAS